MGPKKPDAAANAQATAEAIDDTMSPEDLDDLRKEVRKLRDLVTAEQKYAAQYNDEKLRHNYFWLISKKELEDRQADLRNKERELQDLKERHQIEQKIYRQKTKHLLFQNLDRLTQLKQESQITIKNIEDENRINERELKQDLRALKIGNKEQEVRQKEYSNALYRDKLKMQTKLRQDFERISNEIHQQYQYKMKMLRNEKENLRKQETKKIRERKDAAIAELTQKIKVKYEEIRNYYSEITNTNLEMINELKKELHSNKLDDGKQQRAMQEQQDANDAVVKPLQEASVELEKLKEKKKVHDKIDGQLKVCQKDISTYQEITRDIEWQYEVRLQQFQYLEKEKKELYDEFHRLVYEVHQKTGLRNLILEKKHETIQESLETKDAQINQLLAAARIDPQALGVIRSTLEEVENLKSDAIREIQASLKKIREAHSNMVKTYEGKLSEFGIPVEELGFDPLVPANI